MPIRWVQHYNDKVLRGDGPPPDDGDVYFVGDADSDAGAFVKGELYRGGKKVDKGAHTFRMRSGDDVTFDVDGKGKAQKRQGGVKANGGSK